MSAIVAKFSSLALLDNGADLKAYLRKISEFPLLSLAEEISLAKKFRDEADIQSAHILVTSHLRLVAKIAISFRNYGLPMMDIISEGNIGLMKAIKKFDVDKGFRLSTYALWWIKAQIQEYVLKSWSLVKIGTSLAQKKLFFNLSKIRRKLQKYDHLTNDDMKHISSELGVTVADVKEMDQRLSYGDVYLYDQDDEDDDNSILANVIPSSDPSQEETLIEKQNTNHHSLTLQKALASLNEREREIISARKMLEEPKTLEYLSKVYAISKERIRQIEARAMEKIKAYFDINKK